MAKKPFTPIPPMAELPPAEEINVREILDKYLAREIDLICVLGPTASGKTRYAVQLARQINYLLAGNLDETSAREKRVTPLTAGGGTHKVGGVLFDADVSSEMSEREKHTTSLTAGGGTHKVEGGLFDADISSEMSEREKHTTSLTAGGGTHKVGGVLFDADVSSEISEREKHVTPLTGAEIISADSRQVYRGMDIGTGKDLSEYEEIPYHLMDIVDAGSKYNIFEYQRDFEKAYKDIVDRGGIPILCGGSGLYIEAATCGYSLPEVPPDPELRTELEKKTDEELIAQLASLKPLHNTTDYDTRKRLIRALEIAIYESEHPVQHTGFLPKNTYYIGTLVTRDERNARIDRRLDARLEEGMVEEIRRLLDGTHPALQKSSQTDATGPKTGQAQPITAEDLIYYGLEYKFVTLYLIGELTYEEMRSQLSTAIHQFAKRQMTWFRGMERKGITIHWTNV